MPQEKLTIYPTVFFIFTLIIFGIMFSARAEPYEQGTQMASAKATSLSPDSPAKDGQEYPWVPSPTAHFEPFLLLMLGTFLLSIATGIKFFRSRKGRLESPPATPLASISERLRAPGAKDENH
jgi:hypothetical protein